MWCLCCLSRTCFRYWTRLRLTIHIFARKIFYQGSQYIIKASITRILLLIIRNNFLVSRLNVSLLWWEWETGLLSFHEWTLAGGRGKATVPLISWYLLPLWLTETLIFDTIFVILVIEEILPLVIKTCLVLTSSSLAEFDCIERHSLFLQPSHGYHYVIRIWLLIQSRHEFFFHSYIWWWSYSLHIGIMFRLLWELILFLLLKLCWITILFRIESDLLSKFLALRITWSDERTGNLFVLFYQLHEISKASAVILVTIFTADFVVFALQHARAAIHNPFMISIPIPITFSVAFFTSGATSFTLRGCILTTTAHFTILSNALTQLTLVEAHLPETIAWFGFLMLTGTPSILWYYLWPYQVSLIASLLRNKIKIQFFLIKSRLRRCRHIDLTRLKPEFSKSFFLFGRIRLVISSILSVTYIGNSFIFFLVMIFLILPLVHGVICLYDFSCGHSWKPSVYTTPAGCRSEVGFKCCTGVTHVDAYTSVYVQTDRWGDSFRNLLPG